MSLSDKHGFVTPTRPFIALMPAWECFRLHDFRTVNAFEQINLYYQRFRLLNSENCQPIQWLLIIALDGSHSFQKLTLFPVHIRDLVVHSVDSIVSNGNTQIACQTRIHGTAAPIKIARIRATAGLTEPLALISPLDPRLTTLQTARTIAHMQITATPKTLLAPIALQDHPVSTARTEIVSTKIAITTISNMNSMTITRLTELMVRLAPVTPPEHPLLIQPTARVTALIAPDPKKVTAELTVHLALITPPGAPLTTARMIAPIKVTAGLTVHLALIGLPDPLLPTARIKIARIKIAHIRVTAAEPTVRLAPTAPRDLPLPTPPIPLPQFQTTTKSSASLALQRTRKSFVPPSSSRRDSPRSLQERQQPFPHDDQKN